MADATFDELLQWLQDNTGKSVYLEIGTEAPDTERPADAISVALHVTLSGIEPATNINLPDEMAVLVRFEGSERDRLYLEKHRISRIQIHGAVKIWVLDRFYVGLS